MRSSTTSRPWSAVITESGELEHVNQASLDYHGKSLEEIRRWEISDLVHPQDLPATISALQRSFETGQPLEHEHRLLGADGNYRWFQLRALRSAWQSQRRPALVQRRIGHPRSEAR